MNLAEASTKHFFVTRANDAIPISSPELALG
jgi:hypothetical protein